MCVAVDYFLLICPSCTYQQAEGQPNVMLGVFSCYLLIEMYFNVVILQLIILSMVVLRNLPFVSFQHCLFLSNTRYLGTLSRLKIYLYLFMLYSATSMGKIST